MSLLVSSLKRMRNSSSSSSLSSQPLISNRSANMASNISHPYLAITMQLETSAREIHDTFEHLDSPVNSVGEGDIQESTSVALHLCKRKVLKPYFRLLSMVGWRPIICPIAPEVTWYAKVFNWCYTILITLFILLGYVLQYASCFRLDGYPPYVLRDNDSSTRLRSQKLTSTSTSTSTSTPTLTSTGFSLRKSLLNATHSTDSHLNDEQDLKCSGNFISLYLIPDILHFFAYIFVLQLMRTPECECFQNLLERVFLQATRVAGWAVAQKKLVSTLRSFLWLCLSWVSISVLGHTLHIIAFEEIYFTWMQPSNKLWVRVMTVFTVLSLTFNDIICAAIVTSYSVHCQLNISYINNLVSSIREKRIDFQEFSKRAEESRKFIVYLNTDQALGVSLLIVNFGCRAVVAIFGLLSQQVTVADDAKTAVVVLSSAILWFSLLSVPIIQASRLTASCEELRRIGHELRSRPFGYQETPQDDLDSLLLYTSTIRMEAKLLQVPIKASWVLSILILTVFVILFLGQLNVIKF